MRGFILLISGPSGAGKSTLLARLFEEFKDELYFSISSTTRKPREGEIHGVHYHFIAKDEFERGIERGHFLEWARVHENYYGTSLRQTEEALLGGRIVVFDIDVQGFNIARGKMGEDIVSVFITTKHRQELKNRLLKRNAETKGELEKRLENARDEMGELFKYDYLIINDDLERSYETLRAILIAQKCRVKRQNLKQIQAIWNKGE
ncbi:guanylate kinase [Campylobacter sp.]|uniref:guanylate kinase n=1 Tax=Campylobacter sp. TaxID=205 RepID=UPI0026DA7319|nr:guanylate kinase [Campylobacter sp.]MDO4674683.1 guanylate kinase [Campylobacter sp.]